MTYNPFGYPANNQYIPSGTSGITGVRWVASIDEVNAASIPWGSQIFMDQNRDVFYIKSQRHMKSRGGMGRCLCSLDVC